MPNRGPCVWTSCRESSTPSRPPQCAASTPGVAAENSNPGRKVLHRLNRTEYGNVIRDLFDIEFDSKDLLPPDTASNGFDNIADVLSTDPALVSQYLTAAWTATGRAIGDVEMSPAVQSFYVAPDLMQGTHVEGLPLGTVGGHVAKFYAPVDGEYTISPKLMRSTLDVIVAARARGGAVGGGRSRRCAVAHAGSAPAGCGSTPGASHLVRARR